MNNWYIYVSTDAVSVVDDLFYESGYRKVPARPWFHIPNLSENDCMSAVEIINDAGYTCRYGNPTIEERISHGTE